MAAAVRAPSEVVAGLRAQEAALVQDLAALLADKRDRFLDDGEPPLRVTGEGMAAGRPRAAPPTEILLFSGERVWVRRRRAQASFQQLF